MRDPVLFRSMGRAGYEELLRQRFVLSQIEALVIPHILREPNSIIVLLFIKKSATLSFEEAICVFPVLTKPA